MSSLTICMPSHRPLATALPFIESGALYAKASGANFVLSDNSGDAAKRDFCQARVSDGYHYSVGPDDAFGNWRHAINQAESEFVSVVADDDYLIKVDPSVRFDAANYGPDCVGVRPSMVLWNPGTGVSSVSNLAIVAPKAKERVRLFLDSWAQFPLTITYYSIWRKGILSRFKEILHTLHPTGGSYADWSAVLAYASSGNIYADPSSLFVYNHGNWRPEIANRSVLDLYVAAGLEERTANFGALLHALDAFILIYRKESPVPRGEALEAAVEAWVAYLQMFYIHVQNHRGSFTETELQRLDVLLAAQGVGGMLTACLGIIEAHAPQLVEKYEKYYLELIGLPWGQV